MGTIRITQVKSPVSHQKDQARTLRALGLHRMRDTVEKSDDPTILGMVHKVIHLVEVEKA